MPLPEKLTCQEESTTAHLIPKPMKMSRPSVENHRLSRNLDGNRRIQKHSLAWKIKGQLPVLSAHLLLPEEEQPPFLLSQCLPQRWQSNNGNPYQEMPG